MKKRGREKTKLKGRKAPIVALRRNLTAADLQKQLDQRTRELAQAQKHLAQALEQQTATSEVLRVISSSSGELEPVFDSMLANAVRICEAKFGFMNRYDGNTWKVAAVHGAVPAYTEYLQQQGYKRPGRETVVARIARTNQTVHIADLAASRGYVERDPVVVAAVEIGGVRTMLGVPMLKEDKLIGAILLYRQEVRPFTDKQIELVTNFANQAVIVIENARLLNELRQRTEDLGESLEQQTATSEVLSVIFSSPGELQPVFDTMLENAVRICEASFGALLRFEGGAWRSAAMLGVPPAFAEFWQRGLQRPGPRTALGRVIETRRTVHIADVTTEPAYVEGEPIFVAAVNLGRFRTVLAVPMLKDNELIGVFAIYRQEVRPFSDKQIELVQNFTNQAVIAIENTRLLNELRQRTTDLSEALEQQTATSEVLRVISSSPGELGTVFQTMLVNATKVCEATFGNLTLWEGDGFRAVAVHGETAFTERRKQQPKINIVGYPTLPLARLAASKSVVHVADFRTEQVYLERHPPTVELVEVGGARTLLCVPMLKEDDLIGAIVLYRQEVRPFSNKQIELVKNFAAQAVIAIENVRLLNELRESLQQQTATAEVLRVISSSPGDLGPVYRALLENAVRICQAKFAAMYLGNGETFRLTAEHDAPAAWVEQRRSEGVFRPHPDSGLGLIAAKRQVAYIPDLMQQEHAAAQRAARIAGAADRDKRDPRCDRCLPDEYSAGIGSHRREFLPALRGVRFGYFPARGRAALWQSASRPNLNARGGAD